MQQEGCGFDCSSLTELMLAKAMGGRGNDIMFSSNDTPAEDFKLADELGAIINLDDITHIDFLEKTLGYLPKTICCRYNPGGIFQYEQRYHGQSRRFQVRNDHASDL